MPSSPAKNLILCGMPGTGKTTVGKLLAEALSWEFIDTDALIGAAVKMPVAEFIQRHGEAEFRQHEKRIIHSLEKRQEAVFATGGGAVIDPENRQLFARLGLTVALTATADTLYERLRSSAEKRPLAEKEGGLSLEALRRLLKTREPFYQEMKWCISTDDKTPEAVAQEILGKLKNWQKRSRSP